jgi:hypothetical protein
MNKSFKWRIQAAVTLTSLGVLYYLVFLFYLCGGVPIEKIHYFMTDGWPDVLADNVPYIAPVFLFVGLSLWYSYNKKARPKPIAEPEYTFEFNKVEKHAKIAHEAQPNYISYTNKVKETTEPTSESPETSETTE